MSFLYNVVSFLNLPPLNRPLLRGEVDTDFHDGATVVLVRGGIAFLVDLRQGLLGTLIHIELDDEDIFRSEKDAVQSSFGGVDLRLCIEAQPTEQDVDDCLEMFLVLVVQDVRYLQEELFEKFEGFVKTSLFEVEVGLLHIQFVCIRRTTHPRRHHDFQHGKTGFAIRVEERLDIGLLVVTFNGQIASLIKQWINTACVFVGGVEARLFRKEKGGDG